MADDNKLKPDNLPHLNKYYPITALQQAFWIAQQARPSSSAYTVTRAAEVQGTINIEKLEDCISETIKRHEILRTTFHQVDGTPMQRVNAPFKFKINFVDFKNEPADLKKVKIKEARDQFDRRVWNTEQLPLFYLTVIQTSEDMFWLIFNFNHLIFDGFSISLFIDEVSALYNMHPDFSAMKEVNLQFNDYAVWINQQNANEQKRHEALNFFKNYLQDNEPIHFHSIRKKFEDISSNRSDLVAYELPAKLATDIGNFSTTTRISKFVFMLSVFFILIARRSSAKEITLGLPVVNRYHPKLLSMFGLFLNTSLISQKVDEEMTFLDFLQFTEQNRQQIQRYDSLPYGDLVRELRPKTTLNRNPFFDILFNFAPKRLRRPWQLSQLKQVCEDFNSSETELFLTWYIYESTEGDGLTLGCKTILDILDFKEINTLFWQYHSLLEQVIANPEKKLCEYSLLFPKDIDSHHRAISQDPSQVGDYSNYLFYSDQVETKNPQDAIIETNYPFIPDMIHDHAQREGTHPAIVFGENIWTYAELYSTAKAIAINLHRQGITKGDVVALHGEMSFGLCASIIGVWLAGGVIVLIDCTHPTDYKHSLIQASKTKWLITLLPQQDDTQQAFQDIADLTTISIEPFTVLNPLNAMPLPQLSPDDPCYIFFTSGTTGVPKGVKGIHRSLSHFLNWQRTQFNIGPADRCSQITNLSFDVIMREVFTPLISGATLYIPPPNYRIETGVYLEWLENNHITIQHIVPTLAGILLQTASSAITLRNLRWLFFAGEPLPQGLINQWRNAFPLSGNLVNLYGPTETTLAKAFHIIPQQTCDGIQPIGQPLPQTQILILNKEKKLCGIGEAGEICIRTPYRTMGYINPSPQDKARFVPNPFNDDPNDLLYLSGDLGFVLGDGTICICGRVDDQIKINGIRVDPTGIADTIALNPLVKQCVVVGKKTAEGKTTLVAYVVATDESSPEKIKENILDNLRVKLPNYMIPYAIVLLEKIPVTARGKLDKRALPEPDMTIKNSNQKKLRAPSTQLETELADYWSKEFGLPAVHLDDNFFELGGNSLDGVKLAIHIHDTYKVEFKLHDLITHPTLAQLADYIESGTRENINIQMKLTELSSYTVLSTISKEILKAPPNDHVENIFVTGSAGFLGSYLLNDLIDEHPQAKFYCLVRAKNAIYGLKKIYDSFIQYKLSNAPALKDRIVPVIGDLAAPSLGLTADQFHHLCSTIDVIYHSGALVNFIYSFSQLKPSNVDGTNTIITLSTTQKLKPIHYVSTAGIYPSSVTSAQKIITDHGEIGTVDDVLIGGYVQTKWVADQLMQKAREFGVPVTIYRPGRISWDEKAGIWQEGDAIYRFIRGCIQLGCAPDLPVSLDLNPVNMVSKAIAYISVKKKYTNLNYNIVNPNRVTADVIANYLNDMGIEIDIIPYAEWRQRLYDAFKNKKENALFPLMDLFTETLDGMPRLKYERHFDCQNFLSALEESPLQFPQVNYQFFHFYFAPLLNSFTKT